MTRHPIATAARGKIRLPHASGRSTLRYSAEASHDLCSPRLPFQDVRHHVVLEMAQQCDLLLQVLASQSSIECSCFNLLAAGGSGLFHKLLRTFKTSMESVFVPRDTPPSCRLSALLPFLVFCASEACFSANLWTCGTWNTCQWFPVVALINASARLPDVRSRVCCLQLLSPDVSCAVTDLLEASV